jgi:glycerol-3-phosphate dehydrogenase (NAD(P)+)
MEMNMIAEGYYASSCIHEINKKYKVDLPICNAVYSIIHGKISPKAEMKLLSEKLS